MFHRQGLIAKWSPGNHAGNYPCSINHQATRQGRQCQLIKKQCWLGICRTLSILLQIHVKPVSYLDSDSLDSMDKSWRFQTFPSWEAVDVGSSQPFPSCPFLCRHPFLHAKRRISQGFDDFWCLNQTNFNCLNCWGMENQDAVNQIRLCGAVVVALHHKFVDRSTKFGDRDTEGDYWLLKGEEHSE